MTFDGWVHYNDPATLASPHENPPSFFFGDYIARNIVIRQADIQGLRIGVSAPIKAGDTRDICGNTPGTAAGREQHAQELLEHLHDDALRRDRRRHRDSAAADDRPQRPVQQRPRHIEHRRPGARVPAFHAERGPNPNIIVSDRVVVESFNGNANDNFEVFGTRRRQRSSSHRRG